MGEALYLEILNQGTTTFDFYETNNGNIDYYKSLCTVKVIVEDIKAESVRFKQKEITLDRECTSKIEANVEPWNVTDNAITYKSSNENIVTVDSKGNIKGIEVGTATVTATDSNNNTDTCKITVTEAKITGIKLNRTSYICCSKKIPTGANVMLKTTVFPSYARYQRIVYTSSNKSIASVDSTGKVKLLKGISKANGSVTITATVIDKKGNIVKNNSGKIISTKYTIKREKVNKVTPSKKSITLSKKGRTYNLKAYVYGTKAKKTLATSSDVIWTSSNKKIATVDKNGKVTIRRKITSKTKSKSVTITVKARDNTKKKATIKVITKYQPIKKITTSRYIHFTNYTNFTKGSIGAKKNNKCKIQCG